MKLPPKMNALRDAILYGPDDRKTYAVLEQVLTSFAKNNPRTPAPELANTVTTDRKMKCKHCKLNGHNVADCRAKTHTCNKCGNTGHFEKRCKNKKAEDKTFNHDKHASHYAFATTTATPRTSNSWIIDTGATTSISPHINPIVKTSDTVITANGSTMKSIGYGPAEVGIKLSNVLCVPSANRSLLSIGKACEDGDIDAAIFNEHGCQLFKDSKLVAKGQRRNGLYELERHEVNVVAAPPTIWHHRLAHSPIKTVREILNQNRATGIQMQDTKIPDKTKCKACEIGKATRLPFQARDPERRSKVAGAILHVDLCGPMHIQSLQGSRYSMPITDEYSRFVTTYFMAKKDQAADLILECIATYENVNANRVTTIQADNGGEFTSKYLMGKLQEKGIKLQTTVPYTPEQNGIAERMNRTIVDRARTLLTHAGLPIQYWQFAMATATHITNRLPTNANDRRSPFELWTSRLPDIGHLRVFGCRAFAHIPDQKRHKLDPKATTCIFLGYASHQKGFVLQEESTQKIFTSRDVSFDEHSLPRKSSAANEFIDVQGEDAPISDIQITSSRPQKKRTSMNRRASPPTLPSTTMIHPSYHQRVNRANRRDENPSPTRPNRLDRSRERQQGPQLPHRDLQTFKKTSTQGDCQNPKTDIAPCL